MGFVIRSTSISDNPDEFSSVRLSAEAGERCLSLFGEDREDIDLLINVGIYRDKNILEPAMSAFIQKELRLNNDPFLSDLGKTTFSFDLANGPCSFINALEIVDSMMITGASENALIVSGETHPSQSRADDFPFRNFGAAMILSRDRRAEKRPRFFYKTSQNGYRGLESRFSFQKNAQNLLRVEVEADYSDRLLSFAIDSAREGIETGRLNLAEVRAVITSQPGGGFGRSVAEGLGLSGDLAVDTFDEFGDTHSSALILGYHQGVESGKIRKGDKVLFVAAGSGLSLGCCVF